MPESMIATPTPRPWGEAALRPSVSRNSPESSAPGAIGNDTCVARTSASLESEATSGFCASASSSAGERSTVSPFTRFSSDWIW